MYLKVLCHYICCQTIIYKKKPELLNTVSNRKFVLVENPKCDQISERNMSRSSEDVLLQV